MTTDVYVESLTDMAGAVVSFGTMSTNASTLQMWGCDTQGGTYKRDKQQPLVNIDLGSMALDALRKRSIVSVDDIEETNTK